MKKIFKRIKVNKDFLKLSMQPQVYRRFSPTELLTNEVNDTLPAGKVIGVYFNSYVSHTGVNYDYEEPMYEGEAMRLAPIPFSHTDISLKDSRGRPLTEPTDLRDYEHKGGGYPRGFKELDFESKNEKITIAWETIGGQPICGEFIFAIEQDDCSC